MMYLLMGLGVLMSLPFVLTGLAIIVTMLAIDVLEGVSELRQRKGKR